MFADRAKKQRNIVSAIIVLNTLFRMREIFVLLVDSLFSFRLFVN